MFYEECLFKLSVKEGDLGDERALAGEADSCEKPLTPSEGEKLWQTLPALPEPQVEEGPNWPHPLEPPAAATLQPLAEEGEAQEAPAPAEGEAQREELSAPTESEDKPRLLYYNPQGKVGVARSITLTFSHSMMALGGQFNAEPARLEPPVAGEWVWRDVRTAVFHPQAGRLPMATPFEIILDPSLTDGRGRPLELGSEPLTLETEGLRVSTFAPYGRRSGLNPLGYIIFNQPVDPALVISKLRLQVQGEAITWEEGPSLHLVPHREALELSPTLRRLTWGLEEQSWLAFRAERPLPICRHGRLSLPADLVGTEGPLPLGREAESVFNTCSPLRVTRSHCWGKTECQGLSQYTFTIYFNNCLRRKALDPQLAVTSITPQPSEWRSSYEYGHLSIEALLEPATTYQVELNPQLGDIYGQRLEWVERLQFKTEERPGRALLPGQEGSFQLLDPEAQGKFSLWTINIPRFKVQLWRATWEDVVGLQMKSEARWRGELEGTLTYLRRRLQLVWEQLIGENPQEKWIETSLSLPEILGAESGIACLMVELPREDGAGTYWTWRWLQWSSLGLDWWSDGRSLQISVTNLLEGSPAAGVTVEWGNLKMATDSQGRAACPISAQQVRRILQGGLSPSREELSWWGLRASQHSRRLFVLFPFHRSPFLPVHRPQVTGEVFSDRRLYKPGEEIHWKGWLRVREWGPGKPLCVPEREERLLKWTLKPTRYGGQEIATGEVSLTEMGGWDLAFTLPQDIELGELEITFSLASKRRRWEDNSIRNKVQVADFRTPEYEIEVRSLQEHYVAAEKSLVEARAQYYGGGSLREGEITWTVEAEAHTFSPPGWSAFRFAPPTWSFERYVYDSKTCRLASRSIRSQLSSEGSSLLECEWLQLGKYYSRLVSVQAAVKDLNNQTWTGRTQFLVHPAAYYVGLHAKDTHLTWGENYEIEVIVVDLQGQVIPQWPFTLKASLESEEADGMEAPIHLEGLSASEPISLSLSLNKAGRWLIEAQVCDPQGAVQTSLDLVWVEEDEREDADSLFSYLKDAEDELILKTEAQKYHPGETVKVQLQAPWAEGWGFYFLFQEGFIGRYPFTIAKGRALLEFKWQEEWGTKVQVWAIAYAPYQNSQKPSCAVGSLWPQISSDSKKLQVEVQLLERQLRPGGETKALVKVQDQRGEAVEGAEVALLAVDEAIWALAAYSIDFKGDVFYQRAAGIVHWLQRAHLETLVPKPQDSGYTQLDPPHPWDLDDDDEEDEEDEGPSEGYYEDDEDNKDLGEIPILRSPQCSPIDVDCEGAEASDSQTADTLVRQDFNPLAFWAASLLTDAQGRAEASILLPHSLTRYRVVAVACDRQTRFGQGESTLQTSLPLVVRPSLPRFLNVGDKTQLIFILDNQTPHNLQLEVGVRATNLHLESPYRQVDLPPQSRYKLLIPAQAQSQGEALVQVAAVSKAREGQPILRDSAQAKIPIYLWAPRQVQDLYGSWEGEGARSQEVASPAGCWPQWGGLEVELSTTACQELSGAFNYLWEYPFTCSEQLASRLLLLASTKRYWSLLGTSERLTEREIEEAIERDLELLLKRYNGRGNFTLWEEKNSRIWPFVTLYVIQVLLVLQKEGWKVPSSIWQGSLANLESLGDSEQGARDLNYWTLRAFADNLLYQAGLGTKAHYKGLRDEDWRQLPLDILAWYWPVASRQGDLDSARELRRQILYRLDEGAGEAWESDWGWEVRSACLYSSTRSLALVLSAFLEVEPRHQLVPKLAQSLLKRRKRGYWSTTQETAWSALALKRYFDLYESQEPDFQVDLWLGERYLGQGTFEGRSGQALSWRVPTSQLGSETQALLLKKEGPGRLYYHLRLDYALAGMEQGPLQAGMALWRTFQGLDDPQDAIEVSPNRWRFAEGARLKCIVRIEVYARRCDQVMLEVPIPAGTEFIDQRLAVSDAPRPAAEEECCCLPYGWGFERQNLRAHQVEAFSWSLCSSQEYVFYLRATAPGEYILPPAQAHAMYAPELRGRSASGRVVVE